MNTLIFEPFAGIAGDMTLGAFADLGVPPSVMIEAVDALELPGCALSFEKQTKNGIGCHQAIVDEGSNPPLRHLPDIEKIIAGAPLDPAVQERSLRIFNRLAEVEAEVHRTEKAAVHFHEIGAVDTLVDVVGNVAAFLHLAPEQVYTRPVRWGTGSVTIEHGTYPLPTPATALLLRGLPGFHGDIEKEWTTPTGAALLADFVTSSDAPAGFVLENVGYGSGQREHPSLANVLRIMKGIAPPSSASPVLQIETQVDDMSGEALGHLADLLSQSTALDWFFTPVQMKKNRPGTLITVLCRQEDGTAIEDMLFRHTSTIGLRRQQVERSELERRVEPLETKWGMIRIKVASRGSTVYNTAPEYDDCRRIAEQRNCPVEEVYRYALRHWETRH